MSLILFPAHSVQIAGQAAAQASPRTAHKNIPYVTRTAAISRCFWMTMREAINMGLDHWRDAGPNVVE
jgi:hypothetical protein